MTLIKSVLRAPFVYRARFRDRAAGRSAAHFLSIVCIFRNEAVYLDEWLRFHIGAGVEHFYLYNNFSEDDFAAVLDPYIARGLVTLYDWPIEVGQLPAYRHCVKNHALDSIWMAFIDVDEFLFSPDCISLREILPAYAEFPAVMVHSPYFGSAGIDARPPVPITRAFTKRAPLSRASAKTIANPRWIYAIRNVHAFKYWQGTAVDTDMKPFDAGTVRLDKLRLNHYWSRSLQDLAIKIARGDASTATRRDPNWHYQFEAGLNSELDLSILPSLRKVFPD
jgi:hypothetical protein